MRKDMIVLVTLIFLLTACLPGQGAQDQDLQSRVNTAVAQTMQANEQIANSVAQTVAAQAPLATETAIAAATETPLASPTFTPVSPTVTSLALNPTATFVPAVKPLYACNVAVQKPANYTEIKGGAKFDIRWTLVNVGQRPWPAGTDVKYSSGTKMTNPNRVEITKEVQPGGKFVVDLDATAPNKKGTYAMSWVVSGPMCYPSIIIVVK